MVLIKSIQVLLHLSQQTIIDIHFFDMVKYWRYLKITHYLRKSLVVGYFAGDLILTWTCWRTMISVQCNSENTMGSE